MNRRMKRRIFILAGGLLLGVLVVTASNVFGLEKDQMWNIYFGSAILVIGGSLAFNLYFQLRFMQRVRKTLNVLQENKDLDEFLRATEVLRAKTKGKPQLALLNLNLSYGYSKKENFQKAKEVLEEIDESSLSGINKAIYYSNMASYCFAMGNDQEGLDVIDKHDEFLQKFERTPEVYLGMQVNRLYALLAKGKPEEAKKWAKELQPYCENEDQIEELGKAKQKIAEALNDYDWLNGEEDAADEELDELEDDTEDELENETLIEASDTVFQMQRSTLRTVKRAQQSLYKRE